MEEMFENKVLDDLYNVRRDGFECIFIKHYGEPEEIKEPKKIDEKLKDNIKQIVKEQNEQKQILDVLGQFQDSVLGEMCFWEQQYYKLGFVDGVYFKKEMKEQKEIFANNAIKDNMENDSFFYIWKYSLIEFLAVEIRKKSKEYAEIINKMNEIKKQFDNVRIFLEDREAIELTKEELKAVIEYMNLKEKIEDIEKIEMFKLGLKEEKWL